LPDVEGFEHDVNNSSSMDLDTSCFIIFTNDLPNLLGNMACPANIRINVRDSVVFKDWVHVISDPIMIKIYGGDNVAIRQLTKKRMILQLKKYHHFTLTNNED
jgi:hypothetical protein